LVLVSAKNHTNQSGFAKDINSQKMWYHFLGRPLYVPNEIARCP